jgi:tetratricopeptide (TPR) repeat protein
MLGMNYSQTYKVKLSSGRILGPLDLEKIKLLILKNHITGAEVAREYPQGEWIDINQIPLVAELLVLHAEGKLSLPFHSSAAAPDFQANSFGTTRVLPHVPLQGATQVLTRTSLKQVTEVIHSPPSPAELPGQDDSEGKTMIQQVPKDDAELSADDDRTRMEAYDVEYSSPNVLDTEEPIRLQKSPVPTSSPQDPEAEELLSAVNIQVRKNISTEKTIVFQRSSLSPKTPGKPKKGFKEVFRVLFMALAIGIAGYFLFLAEPDHKTSVKLGPIRPSLPSYVEGKADPDKSIQIYNDAMKYYLADTVVGYKIASEKFRLSAGYDINNVKSLAMLASSYLNLIDSSSKDGNYFSVLSKLIDMSRAKAVDLPETVIADVEFFLVVNKAEAAQNRIIEYTKSHQSFGLEMFYYLALTFYSRGDAATAARYLGQFPDSKAFSSKIFYLKGLIAEKLNDSEEALREYNKALKFNSSHAKSHLRVALLLNKSGKIKESEPNLRFIINHSELLDPVNLGLAYYLHAQHEELHQRFDVALGDMEKAEKLDPENHDYILELYTLRAKAGDKVQDLQKQGRMYYFLGEAEKLILQGKYQDAMVPLLEARNANDTSPLPLVKVGDMFNYLHDIENAKHNYKLASDRAPNNIQVWSKYIATLIQSYEWEEAGRAVDRFRNLPVSQSAIDKAAADMYQKQGRFQDAQVYYKKAMARDSIDPDVYIAYAKSLMSTKNFKDAPFFFALALRFDPLNVDAVINTAKCVAETESIDRAISSLQDELKQGSSARAEYLAAIAEFQIQKGAWDQAQENLDQAMRANPEYAYSWKLQAQVYMNREGLDKNALDKALYAYKEFSQRNASDPSGYLERYKIFVKKADFEKGKEELTRIYEIFPKYPNLHYYLGALYSVQGNHRVAAEEFSRELKNNPDNVQTLIAHGKELIELNLPSDALIQFTHAMQLAPQNVEAKQNAGWANKFLKNYDAALALMNSALKLDKGNPTLYKRLGLIYRDIGDAGNACVAFRKYLEMEPDASDKAEFRACL